MLKTALLNGLRAVRARMQSFEWLSDVPVAMNGHVVRWCVLALFGVPLWAAAAPTLWFADDVKLYQADTSTGALLRTLPMAVKALSADSSGGAWVATTTQILHLNANGAESASYNISSLNLGSPVYLAVDPIDDTVWAAGGTKLAHLKATGEVLLNKQVAADAAVAVAVSLDRRVWLQRASSLTVISPTGQLVDKINVRSGNLDGDPTSMIVDPLSPVLWASREDLQDWGTVSRKLVRVNYVYGQASTYASAYSTSVRAFAVEGGSGAGWALLNGSLERYEVTGSLQPSQTFDLKALGLSSARRLSIEPSSGAFWLAHDWGVSSVSSAGTLVSTITTNSVVNHLSTRPFRPQPTLTLLLPVAQLSTNDATPSFSLAYGVDCYGTPCNIASGRLAPYTLKADLDGAAIGGLFTFDSSTSRASHTVGTSLADGLHQFSAYLTDSFGQTSNTVTSAITVDSVIPLIDELTPASGTRVTQAGITISGRTNEPATIQLGSTAAQGTEFSFPTTLTPGTNDVLLTATDLAGNSTQRTLTYHYLTLDIAAPTNGSTVGGATAQVGGSFAGPSDSQVSVNGVAATLSGTTYTATVALAPGANQLTATLTSGGVTVTKTVAVNRNAASSGSLTPSTVDNGVSSILFNTTAFLYSGSNPVQTGVATGAIEAQRAAVIRGRVITREAQALEGVKVTVLNYPQFGQTTTRSDGYFDMAVNGGSALTVVYEKDGFLPAQRQVDANWQQFSVAPDVVLVGLDSRVTSIDLTSLGMQLARGTPVTDGDGTRQSTVVFPPGTTAAMVMADGSAQPLPTISVRSTEYTVGATGPKAMPGLLPPTSGYTYAVELSVDEAIAAGAKTVMFNQPIFHYVENFLNFPVGGVVPSGYYDRTKGAWIPSKNGRVIKILDASGGSASIDLDGDGLPDDASQLSALGITDAERQQLASLYVAGTSLWRVPIDHFTPWDHNWPYGPPPGSRSPNEPPPKSDESLDDSCKKSGSIIECENQVLGERAPIVGASLTLNYRSDRVVPRKRITVSLIGSDVPPSLKRIELQIEIGGRRFEKAFAPAANQSYVFEWDGLDVYGRPLAGSHAARVMLTYVYPAVYLEPGQWYAAFAALGQGAIEGDRDRAEVSASQVWFQTVGARAPSSGAALGGWTLDVHHAYEPQSRALFLGDGHRRHVDATFHDVIATAVGGGSVDQSVPNGLPAKDLQLGSAVGVASASDGSFYVIEQTGYRILRVSQDGIVTTVAGNGQAGFSGDGGLATAAQIGYSMGGLASGPDGSLYYVDYQYGRVRKIDSSGIITTVAGNGSTASDAPLGDGGPATSARLNQPEALAVAKDGTLYVSETNNGYRIRRIGTDGIITTLVGNGTFVSSGDGGPAAMAGTYQVRAMAVAPDGSLYFTNGPTIRRVGIDGIVMSVAGAWGRTRFEGDGGLATSAGLQSPVGLAFGGDGTLYISDSAHRRVRKVTSNGLITTVAGNGQMVTSGDGGPAGAASLEAPWGVTVDPSGDIYVAQRFRVRRVGSAMPGFSLSDSAIASEDGRELYHFDPTGRHLRTLNSRTGAVLREFGYVDGVLRTITDQDRNVTRIERDTDAKAVAVVAPDGQRTTLTYDSNGWLNSIKNPLNEAHVAQYTDNGLLVSFSTPRGNASTMQYDDSGRLVRDQNAADGSWNLVRSDDLSSWTVSITSAEGRTTSYRTERPTVGGRRRTILDPDGKQMLIVQGTTGNSTTTTSDGSVISTTAGPDPRFGMQAPVTSSSTTRLPSGLTWTASAQRTITLSNPADLSSVSEEINLLTLNGRTFKSVYDTATRGLTLTSAQGRTSMIRTDDAGRLMFSQASGLAPASVTYDARGRLSSVTQGSGADARSLTYAYGSDGYVASVTDALTQSVVYQRDTVGRPTQTTLPGNRVIGAGFDGNGNVTTLTPPGRPAHAMAYTPVDLEGQYTPPTVANIADPTTRFSYNRDKDLTRIDRPDGTTIEFAYLPSGQLSTIAPTPGAGNAIAFSYSSTTGQVATLSNADAAIGFTYDGPLVTQETISGTLSGSIARAYDNDFRIKQITVNGASTGFGYDGDSLLTAAGLLTVTRDPSHGLITGTTLGNVTTSQSYNGFGELATFSAQIGSTALLSYQLEYDRAGRISAKTETATGVTTRYDYGYDSAGRLATVKRDGTQIASYGYDANGNRTTLNGTVVASVDAQDRLQTYGSESYLFTAFGALQSKTDGGVSTLYRYDAFGNLKNVQLPGDITIDYLVDGANRRIGKKINGALVQGFLWQDQLRIAAELDSSGQITARFVYGERPNVPEYILKGGNTYRVITDHLGSVRLVVDSATGAVVQRIDYDAWGKIISDSNPGFQPFGYAGGLYDQHMQLVRFGARDYDAQTGRWTAKDPIRFAGGDTNLYAYAGGNPISGIDPSGLFCVSAQARDAIATGVGTAAGAAASGVPLPVAAAVGAASGLVTYGAGPTAGGTVAGIAQGAAAGRSVGAAVSGGIGGLIGGLDGGTVGAVIGGAYDGMLGPPNRMGRLNPNGWSAVAGPVSRGIWGGLVSGLVTAATTGAIDFVNEQFGDCGCGK